MNIVISGSGLYHPSDVITNEELVESYNQYATEFNEENKEAIARGEVKALELSSAEFIEKASGIKRRYLRDKKNILDPKVMQAFYQERPDEELCLQAEEGVIVAREALKNANKKAEDIDAVIVSCTHKQRDYPSIAIEIQNALGCKGFAFDMGVGCSSATFGIQTAVNNIKAGAANSVLVITPEVGLSQVNYGSRDSHFIFGEAQVAVVVERAELSHSPCQFKILDTYLFTQYSNNIRNNSGAFIRSAPDTMYAPDKTFYQEGRKVFKEVTPVVIETITQRLARLNIKPEQVARYWLHQANANMNRVIAEKLLGPDYGFERAPIVLDEFANTAGAGSVIAFHRYHDGLKSGDYAVLCSFGAGYSIGCIILQKV